MKEGMQNIIRKMRSQWEISDFTITLLEQYLTPCSFPKNFKLIESGKRCRKAYFIEKGFTRSYWLVEGNEITTSFTEEGAIVFSMDELYYDRISEEFVESMESVEGFSINIDDLKNLFKENLELANWGRIIHQNEYRRLHRSHKERLTLKAPERYKAFMEQFPAVGNKANLRYIASYLGITPSTMSRLRKHLK